MLPIVFCVFVIVMSIIYMASVENDKYIFSVIVTALAVMIYFSEIVAILSNWQMVLLCAGAYLLVGGGWSVIRWFKYCKKFIEKHPEVPSYQSDVVLKDYYKEVLSPANKKSQITGWIIYWPWSMLWNVVGDVITVIYDALQGVYTKIADKIIEKAISK